VCRGVADRPSETKTPGGTTSGGKKSQPFAPVRTAFQADVAFGSLLRDRLSVVPP
jgi:hypothetical protein